MEERVIFGSLLEFFISMSKHFTQYDCLAMQQIQQSIFIEITHQLE